MQLNSLLSFPTPQHSSIKIYRKLNQVGSGAIINNHNYLQEL